MKAASLVLLLTATSSRADAQSADAQADELFRRGRALVTAGKIAEGCAALEASQKAAPANTTLLNLASCREKNGQLATAWRLFVIAKRQTLGAIDDASRQLHEIAVNQVSRLEPRLSRLTVKVDITTRSPIAGLEVMRDNDVLDAGSWNQALPVDGGTYKLTARAPGRTEWTTTITIKPEGDSQFVDVPILSSDATAAVEAARIEAIERRKAEQLALQRKQALEQLALQRKQALERSYDRHPVRIWTIVGGSAGIAAMFAGSVFAVRTSRAQTSFDDAGCGDPSKLIDVTVFDECTKWRDGGQRDALLGNVFLAGGAAIVAASVIVFVIDPGNVERPRATVAVSPASVNLVVRW